MNISEKKQKRRRRKEEKIVHYILSQRYANTSLREYYFGDVQQLSLSSLDLFQHLSAGSFWCSY